MGRMNLREQLLKWMRSSRGARAGGDTTGGGGGDRDDGDFTEIALEVFRFQFAENAGYRNYCRALGMVPDRVTHWREIPAVPTDVFKLEESPLRCFAETETSGWFLTSGTTREVKGRHEFRDLALYEASVLGGWREMGLPPAAGAWFFSQRAEDAPHSSLVRMFEILAREHGGGSWLIDAGGRFRTERFQPRAPAAVLGTSLALLRACEEMEPVGLPEGSWIFETGGGKGLREDIPPGEIRRRLGAQFGVPESRITQRIRHDRVVFPVLQVGR